MIAGFKVISGGLCPLTPLYDRGLIEGFFPKSFSSDFESIEVKDVLDQWLNGSVEYYKISTFRDETLIVKHNGIKNTWEVSMWLS